MVEQISVDWLGEQVWWDGEARWRRRLFAWDWGVIDYSWDARQRSPVGD
jgi:hypothetical protein